MTKGENYSKNSIDIATQLKILAKVDYEFYLEYTHNGLYRHGRHTKLICDKLKQVEEGKIKRLMIFLPPRHSKSMTISESFPSYFIGKNPNKRAILVSYGSDLAKQFGRENKNKLDSYGKEIFDVTINRNYSSVSDWGLEGYRGGILSTGLGGAITGKGADLLVIDDPVKNRKEANSETYRNMVWNEWQNTLLTRLQPDGAVILIMTRWHEDDLAGRLLNPEYSEVQDWEIVSLPCVAENDDDLLGRKRGETLWPEYGFNKEWAESTKRAVGSQTWASLYQQRPSPEDGTIVNTSWWNFYTEKPSIEDFDEIIQSWDANFKETENGSYVVGQLWGRKGPDKYLLDQYRERMDFTKTIKAIKSFSNKHPYAIAKLVEDKANGPAIISTLRRKIVGIIPVEPRGSKIERASAVAPQIEAGNVYLPSRALAPWIDDFINEWKVFPNGSTDDMVDCTSQALNRFEIVKKRQQNYHGKGRR